ncbi:MAG: mitochondrial fission ELM1 family protein, partial [Sedimenticola sp.]|nr:mitochondrial fission ELM1 family protein [Sedimenticola sp.]
CEPTQGLILLGGLSPHYQWDDEAVLEQVASIVKTCPEGRFVLSDSRRTPIGLMEKLASRRLANLALVPHQQTAPGWVQQQLGLSHSVWVSEDSVSMVYEAITSGAAVGLISLPVSHSGRISKGIKQLIEEAWLTPYAQWKKTGVLTHPPGAFNEASRCADWLVDQWL